MHDGICTGKAHPVNQLIAPNLVWAAATKWEGNDGFGKRGERKARHFEGLKGLLVLSGFGVRISTFSRLRPSGWFTRRLESGTTPKAGLAPRIRKYMQLLPPLLKTAARTGHGQDEIGCTRVFERRVGKSKTQHRR